MIHQRINNGVFFFPPCVFTDPGAVYREMEICVRGSTHTCELQQEALRGPWRASPRGLFLRAPGLRSDSSSPWTAPGRYHPSYPTCARAHTHARGKWKKKKKRVKDLFICHEKIHRDYRVVEGRNRWLNERRVKKKNSTSEQLDTPHRENVWKKKVPAPLSQECKERLRECLCRCGGEKIWRSKIPEKRCGAFVRRAEPHRDPINVVSLSAKWACGTGIGS